MITTVRIAGMRTEHCKRAIFTALTPVHGITRATVSLGAVEVEHDGTVTAAELRDAIEVTGYAIKEIVEQPRALSVLPTFVGAADVGPSELAG